MFKQLLTGGQLRPALASLFLGLGLAIVIVGPSLAHSGAMARHSDAAPPLTSRPSLTPRENGGGIADHKRLRAEYWANRLGLQFGVPPQARPRAIFRMRLMEQTQRALSGTTASPLLSAFFSWTFIGPQPMLNALTNFGGPIAGATFHAAGRISAIAADPTTVGRLFVGGAGGGVWMSTDSGITYVPIFDAEPSQMIGAIALDAVNTSPPTVYVATGEGNNSVDSYYGHGIFKSTDLGASWTLLGPPGQFDQTACSRLAVDTTHNPPFLYAAITIGDSSNRSGVVSLQGGPLNDGLWRSTDGGASWIDLNGADTSCGTGAGNPCPANDIVIDPASPANIYAAIQSEDVFVSTDNGNSFAGTGIGSRFTPSGGMGRASLAVGPPAPGAPRNCAGGTSGCGMVYTMIGSGSNGAYQALLKSTDGGSTWISTASVPSFTNSFGTTIDGTSGNNFSQSDYDQTLLVSATNPAVVLFGGVGIYGSSDFGNTWSFLPGTKGGVHSDQHALALAPDNDTVFLGNDGGAFKFSLDAISGGVANFIALNDGLSTGQIQGLGPFPNDNKRLIAGFQDNGTQLDTGTRAWNSVDTGDGGFSLFDQNNTSLAYHTLATNGGGPVLSLSTDSAATWNIDTPTTAIRNAMAAAGDAGAIFYPPLANDPSSAGRILFGAHHVYSSTDGMQTFTEQETTDLTGAGCTNGQCALEDIEFAPGSPTLAWALAAQSGSVPFALLNTSRANFNSGAFWIDVTANLPFPASAAQATGISPDPNNANNAFLSISGFTAATRVGHIFRTTDFGTTWNQADGAGGASPLPDVPVTRILVDKSDPTGNTVLAGTDIGVFRSTDAGNTWAAFNLGVIPAVPVFDIEQNNNDVIFAGTHGRGAFQLISGPPPTATPTPVPTQIPTPSATSTPSSGPLIANIPNVILVGGSFNIMGSGFTAGSTVNFFVSTSKGPVNAGPLVPSSFVLPNQLTISIPATTSLGQGFVDLQVVNSDQGFAASNLAPALLQGDAAAGIPSITSINGVGLAATSSDPSFATDNVEIVVAQGAGVTLGGTGFDTTDGVAIDLFCACPGGKVGPFFLNPGDPGLSSTLIVFNLPSSGANAPATGPGSFVVSNAGGANNYALKSNAVSVPIGQPISVSSVSQVGGAITVDGTGFSTLTVINFFNAYGGGVVNLGGLGPGGAPNIPLKVLSQSRFTFTKPAGAVPGNAYVQALNPPFVPFTSSGTGSGGAFTLR